MLCDVVVLYIVKRKSYYRTKKYQYVNDPDEEVSDQASKIREIIKGSKDNKMMFVSDFTSQQLF